MSASWEDARTARYLHDGVTLYSVVEFIDSQRLANGGWLDLCNETTHKLVRVPRRVVEGMFHLVHEPAGKTEDPRLAA